MLYMVFQAGMNIPITRESIYHALAQNNTPSAIKKPSYEKSIFFMLNTGYSFGFFSTSDIQYFYVSQRKHLSFG